MEAPSIKGTLFSAVVDDVNGMVESGRVSAAKLEARLEPDDLALLSAKINAAGWYPLDSYHRMVDLLREAEGAGESYWCERGRRAARRLLDAGIYHQFDYLGRTAASAASDPQARFTALAKDLRLLLTLQAAMLNFGDWKCVVDPDHGDRYRVEMRDIAGVPDGIFLATLGMFNEMSLLANARKPIRWEYERLDASFAVIRMTHAA